MPGAADRRRGRRGRQRRRLVRRPTSLGVEGRCEPARRPGAHQRRRLAARVGAPSTWPSSLWRNLAQTIEHEARMDAYRHVQEPGARLLRGPVHRRADGDPQRRRQPARALPRRRRERDDRAPSSTWCSSARSSSIASPLLFLVAFLPIPVIVCGSAPLPAPARAPLRRRARAGRAPRRHARQQPRRHRHHQGLHRRGPRDGARGRRQPRPTARPTADAIQLQLGVRPADPHGDPGRLHDDPAGRRARWRSTATSASASSRSSSS